MGILNRGPGRGGVWGAVDDIFTGQYDESLSAEQNNAARKRAFIMSGLQMLSSDPRMSTVQAMAQGALAGQQTGSGVRQGYSRQAAMQGVMQSMPPEQRAMFESLSPEAQEKVMTELATRQQQKPELMNVGVGASVYDPSTGQPIFTNEAQRKPNEGLPPEMVGIAALKGITDLHAATPEQKKDVLDTWESFRRSGAANLTVNNNPERASEMGVTDAMIGQYNTDQQRAVSAEDRLNSLGVMEAALNSGLRTGGLEALTGPMRSIAASVGMADPSRLSREEAFRAVSNKVALEMKEGMTGPMSDRDIMFLQQQVPAMANTVQGNKILIEVLRRTARRQIELADLSDKYFAERGSLVGYREHRSQWLRENPLTFTDLYNGPAPWGR